MPACWHREQETKIAAAPELTVGLQKPIIAFVPRPAVSETLHHTLGSCSGETTCRLARPLPAPAYHADCRVAVLHGTGGVGKTQLALVHACLPQPRIAQYRLRWWIAAEQRDGLQAQYRHFAQRACIPGVVGCDFPALVSAVNSWLSARPDWLVVFDNVPAFDDGLADILPPTPLPSQHVIITSRHTEWPAAYRTVSVDVMDEAEARQLLKAGAGIGDDDRSQDADISALAKELGHLPLVLSHAAAYVKQCRISFADYLSRYVETSLLDSQRDRRPTGDPYLHAVAQTWDMSIAAVDEEAKAEGVPALGRALLTACAYLNPDTISRSLLRRWLSSSGLLLPLPSAALGQPASLLPRWLSAVVSFLRWSDTGRAANVTAAPAHVHEVLDALLAALSRYSLLHFAHADRTVVRLHRVLGRVLRHQHQMQQQEQQAPAAATATRCPAFDSAWRSGMVAAATAEYKASSPLQALRDLRLLSHLQSLQRRFDHSEASSSWEASLARADLLHCLAGAHLHRLNNYRQAKEHAEQALAICEALHPRGHLRVAIARFQLADACGQLGEYVKQRELLQRVLPVLEAQSGMLRDLARTLAALGGACCTLGEHGRANELLQRAGAMQAALCGANQDEAALLSDLDSLAVTVGHLSRVYAVLYGPVRQREALELALFTRRFLYGEEHVRVADTLHVLGSVHSATGDHAKAIEVLERAAEIKRAAYGESHAQFGVALHSLGEAYGAVCNRGKQRRLLERALSILESQLGREHRWVVVVLCDLAKMHRAAGDVLKARELLQRALTITEARYGKQHADGAAILESLSHVHVALGELAEARQLQERVRAIDALQS